MPATEHFFQCGVNTEIIREISSLICSQCYAAAIDVVKVFDEELSAHKRYLRHGPEAQCIFVTFASAFLIKVRPFNKLN